VESSAGVAEWFCRVVKPSDRAAEFTQPYGKIVQPCGRAVQPCGKIILPHRKMILPCLKTLKKCQKWQKLPVFVSFWPPSAIPVYKKRQLAGYQSGTDSATLG